MQIRAAQEADAPAMGRVMVDTYLQAHKDHMPAEAWHKRQAEWTPEVSAQGWERSLRAIADGSNPSDCIYLATEKIEEKADGAASDEIMGLVMGGPAGCGPWANAGEIYALYVLPTAQGQGTGRALVGAAADQLGQLGMSALVIRCLQANAAGNRFYTAIGGQVVGEYQEDEYGYLLPGLIYGWSDRAAMERISSVNQ
jgi:GNAT superfamily N-acetyltransferase